MFVIRPAMLGADSQPRNGSGDQRKADAARRLSCSCVLMRFGALRLFVRAKSIDFRAQDCYARMHRADVKLLILLILLWRAAIPPSPPAPTFVQPRDIGNRTYLRHGRQPRAERVRRLCRLQPGHTDAATPPKTRAAWVGSSQRKAASDAQIAAAKRFGFRIVLSQIG
jgi:hypothetical protein